MGYPESKNALLRVKTVLDTIVALPEPKRVTIPTQTPRKLSYAIFAAFKYCKKHEKNYESYLKIHEDYKVRERDTSVVFEPRTFIQYDNPVVELRESKAMGSMELDGITTIMEVVGACIKHNTTIKFNDFPLMTLENNERLSKWAGQNNYTFSYGAQTLTMIKNVTATQDGVSQQR